MNEPTQTVQRQVIYMPPAPEVIEKYAYDVCQELEKRYGKEYVKSEVISGFTIFLKEAAKIYASHLTRKHNEEQTKVKQ